MLSLIHSTLVRHRTTSALLLGITLFIVLFSLADRALPALGSVQDVQIYAHIAERVEEVRIDYLDAVRSEYPPLVSSYFWLVYLLGGMDHFPIFWILLLLLGILFVARLHIDWVRGEIFLFSLILTILFLGSEVVFARFDIFVALALFSAYFSLGRSKIFWAAFWIALAGAIKILPILLLPLLFVYVHRSSYRAFFLGTLTGVIIAFLPPLLLLSVAGTVDAVIYVLTYHGERAVHLETVWSGLSMLWSLSNGFEPSITYGHWSLGNNDVGRWVFVLSPILVLMFLGALMFRSHTHKKSLSSFPLFAHALLLLMLAVGPILSPQFFVWVVPTLLYLSFDALVHGRAKLFPVLVLLLTIGVSLTTQWIFPLHYQELIRAETVAVTMLNVRNLLLLMLTAVLTVWAWRTVPRERA